MNPNEEIARELTQILKDSLVMPLSEEEVRMLCCAVGIDSADVLRKEESTKVPPTPQEWYDHIHDDMPW